MTSELWEGDDCPIRGCDGVLELDEVENCSCHINPQCGGCESVGLVCAKCGCDDVDEIDWGTTITD